MAFVLSPHFTSDAVPEKRTADEEHQPPSMRQAQEYVRGQDESIEMNTGSNNERVQAGDMNTPSNTTEGANGEKAHPETKKKSKKTDGKKKRTASSTNIVNISQCSGFHIFNNTNISNNWNLNGMPSTYHKSNSPSHSTMQNQSNANQHSSLPIPEKIFHCFEKISEEDCTIVSEYITCDWKTLSEQLFPDHLKDYIAPTIQGKSKKEAVRLILIRWKQVNYKVADVSTLAHLLKKLNAIDALIRLGNRHGIK